MNFFQKKKKKEIYLITFAMFYDIEDPNAFAKDILIYQIRTDYGYQSFLSSFVKNLTYDGICHEHVTYYTLTIKIAKQSRFQF